MQDLKQLAANATSSHKRAEAAKESKASHLDGTASCSHPASSLTPQPVPGIRLNPTCIPKEGCPNMESQGRMTANAVAPLRLQL